jgi:hypothetical protein
MKIVRSLPALALGVVLATSAGHAATWEGDLLNVQFLSPNPQTVVFNENVTVPASGIDVTEEGFLLLSIEASLVRLVNTTINQFEFTGPSDFAVVKITDLTASRIENAQVDPDSTFSLQGPLITGNNFLQFDLTDAVIIGHGVLNLQVSFFDTSVAIPEPGSLPVFASALLGLLSAWWMTSGRGRGRSTKATAT